MQGTRCRTPASVLASVTEVEVVETVNSFLTRGLFWFGTIPCKMPILVAFVVGGPTCVFSSSAGVAGRIDTGGRGRAGARDLSGLLLAGVVLFSLLPIFLIGGLGWLGVQGIV